MTSGRQGTFGQRGMNAAGNAASAPTAELQAVADEPEEREPGLLASLFGIGSSEDDEFDVRLSEEYAPGKTLWLIVPLWLILGSFGAHRFYIGHIKMGLAIIGLNIALSVMVFSTAFDTVLPVIQGQGHDEAALAAALATAVSSARIPASLFGLWIMGDGIYVIVRKLRPM